MCVVAVVAAMPAIAHAGSGGVCAACEPEKPVQGTEGAAPDAKPERQVLSLRQLRGLARRTGFHRPRLAAAIAMAESSGDTRARHRNRHRHRSIDRGLFQINSRWHPDVSKRCAFDPECNAREALRISAGGRDWSPWTVWHTKAYRQYL